MNAKDFLRLGVPLGEATRRATDFVAKFILGGGDKSRLHEEVAAIVANPSAYAGDPLRGEFAKALLVVVQSGQQPVGTPPGGDAVVRRKDTGMASELFDAEQFGPQWRLACSLAHLPGIPVMPA